MSNESALSQRAAEAWQGLTERERKLLSALGVILVVGSVLLSANFLRTSLNTYEAGITEGHDAIELLVDERADYLGASAQAAAFNVKLEANQLRLAAFVEDIGRTVGVGTPRDFRDQETPVPNFAGITRQATTVTFPDVASDKLGTLLSAIENSDEIVYLDGFEMQPTRNSGSFELTLTLATFRITNR